MADSPPKDGLGSQEKPELSGITEAEVSSSGASAQGVRTQNGSTAKSGFGAIFLSWWTQISALVFAAAIIAGLSGFLYAMDGRNPSFAALFSSTGTLSKVARHITVNTILEVFKMILDFALGIPLTKSAAQLAWAWYSTTTVRPLSDYLLFESALSHSGVPARAQMLSFVTIRPLGWLVAFVAFTMLLNVLLGLFTQQLVAYETVVDPAYGDASPQNGTARLQSYANQYWLDPSTNIFDPPKDLQVARLAVAANYSEVKGSPPYYLVNTQMKASLWAALYDVDPDYATPQFYCATGNCTWGDYWTLGICSRCVDLTPKLSKLPGCFSNSDNGAVTAEDGACNITLPNGFGIGDSMVMRIHTTSDPIVFKNYSGALAIIQSVAAYDGVRFGQQLSKIDSSTLANASECALIPCGIHLRGAETASLGEERVAGINGATFYEYFDTIWDNYTVSADGPVVYTPPGQGSPKAFHISNESYTALSSYIASLFNGYAAIHAIDSNSSTTTGNGELDYISTSPIRYNNAEGTDTDGLEVIFDPRESACTDVNFNRVEDWAACAVISAGVGMTNGMRDSKFSPTSFDTPLEFGLTMSAQPFVVVAWLWLVPIVFIWLCAALLTVLTMSSLGRCARLRHRKRHGKNAHEESHVCVDQEAQLDGVRDLNPLALLFIEKKKDSQLYDVLHSSREGESGVDALARKADDAAGKKVRLEVTRSLDEDGKEIQAVSFVDYKGTTAAGVPTGASSSTAPGAPTTTGAEAGGVKDG